MPNSADVTVVTGVALAKAHLVHVLNSADVTVVTGVALAKTN